MANAFSIGTCTCGKDVFPSKSVANRAAKELVRHSRKNSREVRVYECSEAAGVFHLTQQHKLRAARASVVRESTDLKVAVDLGVREFGPKLDKPKGVPIRAKAQPKNSGPEKTSCKVCGRLWRSDYHPAGRICPSGDHGCGAVDSYVIGWRDRGKSWVRQLAA